MKTLLYPSAGNDDWKIAFDQFKDKVDKFIFVDINYTTRSIDIFKNYLSKKGVFVSDEISGSFASSMSIIKNGDISFRDIEQAYYTIKIKLDNSIKTILFRKGFGEYALNELEDNSLSVFYHRGDSQGEGGSNVFYLANKSKRHEKLSMLFDKLIQKLQKNALIVTDGSNIEFSLLKKVYKGIDASMSKKEVENQLANVIIKVKNSTFKFLDVLDYRYNHTLVWEVSK